MTKEDDEREAESFGPDRQLDENDKRLIRMICESVENGESKVLQILEQHQKAKQAAPNN